jgi:hypothetical protein
MTTSKPAGEDIVPRAYVHDKCGTTTRVSDDIIDNYLADPFFYSDGTTICAECGEVLDKDCRWEETGQRVDEYMRQLQAQKGTAYHVVRWGIWVAFMVAGALIVPPLLKGGKGVIPFPWDVLGGVLAGGLVAFFAGRYLRLMLCKMKVI